MGVLAAGISITIELMISRGIDYDPAANHKATHGWVTDTWMINASTGTNSIRFISGKQCTHYWVKKIELELNNSLANSSTAETQIDHLMLAARIPTCPLVRKARKELRGEC